MTTATWSIRVRLTVVSAAAVTVLLGVSAVALVVVQQQQLIRGIDDVLQQRAQDLIGLIETGNLPSVLADIDDDDSVAQVVGQNGEVVAASRRAANVAPLVSGVTVRQATTVRTEVDNEDFRVVSQPVEIDGHPSVIHVATAVESVADSRDALVSSLLVGIPAAVLALAILTWWLVGWALRPVGAIQRQVREITADQVGRRVPVPAAEDEIGTLARLMNQMLDRLEEASIRQRRFVGDAAHELRSPLTRIRSEIEVDLAHPATADPRRTQDSVLEEAILMQRLVDDLLWLARYDAGASPRRSQPVDLGALVSDGLVLGEPRIRMIADGPVIVDADPTDLRRAIGNVVDNALRHTETGVQIHIDTNAGGARVAVVDDGPGIPLISQDAIFERFTRLDAARSQNDGGTGLGLAIAREIIERHDGTVTVDPDFQGGTRIVFQFPTSRAALSQGRFRNRS